MLNFVSKYRKLLSALSVGCGIWCISMLSFQISYAERVMIGLEKCYFEDSNTCSPREYESVRMNHTLWNSNARYYGLASAFFFTLYGGLLYGREDQRTKLHGDT